MAVVGSETILYEAVLHHLLSATVHMLVIQSVAANNCQSISLCIDTLHHDPCHGNGYNMVGCHL